MTTAKKVIDWERVEGQYRAGVLSVREIGAQHGVSHTAINKRAKAEGWDRDLTAKIQAKADALVSKAQVSKEVSSARVATERETVDANAKAIADVRLGHRTDIKSGRTLVAKLLDELCGVTERPDLIEDLISAIGRDSEDDDLEERKKRTAKLRDALDRLMSLPGRVSAVKGLAEALRHLIGLEREAWGIDAKEKDPSDLDDLSDEELDRRIEKYHAKANAAAGTPATG